MSLPFMPCFFSSLLSNNFIEKGLRKSDRLKTMTEQSHKSSEKGTGKIHDLAGPH